MSLGFRTIIQHGLSRGLPSKAGFSRRQILKIAAATAAHAMWGGCSGSVATSPQRAQSGGLRVAIVGAGFAGLACADTLARGGADVTVFEISSRSGGRVLTDRKFIAGKNVELGAEFIGLNHPTWIEYARRFGITLVPAIEYEADEPILLDGRLIRGEDADRIYTEADATIAKLIELARPIDPTRPWKSPDAQRLDRMSYEEFLRETNLSADARKLLATIAEADNGVPPQRMSMLAYLSMIAGGGFQDYFEISETHRARGGNDALATAMANSLGSRVRFNCGVLSIQRTKSHAVVTSSRSAPFECDAVVLAIPPSVWPKVAFESPFGQRIPQMGKNVKLITRVDRPVWEDQKLHPEVISDGLVQLTWISAENEPGLPKSFTLFSGGHRAQELREIEPKMRTGRAIESLRPAYPTLAGAVSDSRFIDWPGMTNAMASYSFPAPGEVCRYGPILVDGWDDGLAPLRFAGEHTSYGFIGYMEGALQSGVRVGKTLLASVHRA